MRIRSIIATVLVLTFLLCGCAKKPDLLPKDGTATTALPQGTVVKTEHVNVSDAILEYIFYYNFYEQYAPDADYYGLSLDLTFSEQMYSKGVSWQQHLSELALSEVKKYALLKEDGINKGFEFTPDVDSEIENHSLAAQSQGMSLEAYLKSYYGEKATEETVRAAIELRLYALEYEKELKNGYIGSLADADYDRYYEANRTNIEIVDALTYSIPINYYGIINSEKRDSLLSCETPEEFKEWIANDLREKNESADTPKTPEELEAKIAEKTEVVMSYYTPGGDFSEWAFAEDTELYDTHYAEKNTGMYDIYMLVRKPYAWEKYNHNVGRIVLSGKDYATIDDIKSKAEEIIVQLGENGGTAEAFEALYKEYNGEGECFSYNVQDDFFGDESSRVWLKDEVRKEGDVTALATPDGYSIIYYAGRGVQRWMADANEKLSEDYINTYLAGLEGEYGDSLSINEGSKDSLPESLP